MKKKTLFKPKLLVRPILLQISQKVSPFETHTISKPQFYLMETQNMSYE